MSLDPWSTMVNVFAVPTAAWQLSDAMRAASQQEHAVAEQSPFMTELLRGALGREAYVAYLQRLRVIYSALEEAVRRQSRDSIVAPFYDPALERVTALDADLDFWSGGLHNETASPAAVRYQRHLDGNDDAAVLVAHHYTRYLGDLSGGQLIARSLRRVFGLVDDQGLQFYAFPFSAKRYKDGYRSRLDALSLRAEQVETLLREVPLAFRRNQELLDELASEFCTDVERDE